jgi:N-acetylglucosamine kinase-like BadF-type ATPase
MRVLGVDGGQSGIRLRSSLSPTIVEVDGVSRLEGDTVSIVAAAVIRAWRQGSFGPVERIVLGLSTAPVDAAEADRLCATVGSAIGARDVWLADDAVTSHAGALSLGWGVSVIAGTGVACLARPVQGAAMILGGHGYLLGDEGGGFWIGRRALADVLRTGEGRATGGAEVAALTAAAERRFGSLVGLSARLHASDRPIHAIAGFAQDVQAAASSGDQRSRGILADATAELIELIGAGVRSADGNDIVPLALGGRLLGADAPLRRMLDEALANSGLPVVPRSADGTGLDGAIRLGLMESDHPYGELIHGWRQQVPV